MGYNQKNVPLEEDIAVYAKAVLTYKAFESKVHLAVLVLAQRVVIEHAKRYKLRKNKRTGKNVMAELYQLLDNIATNEAVAVDWSRKVGCTGALGRLWPNYLYSELIK